MAAPEHIGILFLSSVPKNTVNLRTDEEHREIIRRIENGANKERFTLKGPHMALQAKEIQDIIREKHTHIVHFSGHGNKDGYLVVEDASGHAKELPRDAVRNLFHLANQDRRTYCVVLNGCHTLPLAQALVSEPVAVPCAVGIKDAIDDDAAIAFADGFYNALARGERSLQQAFDYGVNQVGLLASRPSQADLFVLEVADNVDKNQPLFGR
jgi:hypothetical protein